MTAVTQARVVASEWTKLHSLRSSRITLLVALGLVVGLGLFVPLAERDATGSAGTPTAGYDAVERSLGGIFLAQLAFGVLGAMVGHRRVRDRDDPGDVRRRAAAAAGAVGEARRVRRGHAGAGHDRVRTGVRRRPGDLRQQGRRRLIRRPARRARGVRLRALPGRDGRVRARARRAGAQHRGRDHDADPGAVRSAGDRRPAARGRTRSARTCRARPGWRSPRSLPGQLGPWERLRRAVRLRCGHDGERPPSCWSDGTREPPAPSSASWPTCCWRWSCSASAWRALPTARRGCSRSR